MTDPDKTKEELKVQFINEIKNHKHFKEFFKDYTPSSVESFIKLYALKKATWTIYGPTFKKQMEDMETQWVNMAMERMAEIQQVKLFLFQCRYRAGLVEERVEGVRTIFDFFYWKDNVLNASFLEPVTEQDITLYCQYMRSDDNNHEPLGFLEGWQDFESIREAYNGSEDTDRDVPAWYEFYFNHTGHGVELMLPDIKKEKDTFYFLKGNQERIRLAQEAKKIAIAENKEPPPEEGKYFVEHAPEGLSLFMDVFEDRKNREMHKIYEDWGAFNEKEDMLRDDLDVLLHAGENVPVEENEDWLQAIRIAAARYRTQKIADYLPAAYEQYKMNLTLGISFPEHEASRKESDFYNDLVLLGRKLMGEKEDFEY
ncbi:MAG TPA: hypothetical protein VIQ00_11530 [Chitinophagaceae bacterium]